MPVDDTVLESLKLKVGDELRINNVRRHGLDTMQERIHQITKAEEPDPTEADPTRMKKVIPMDMLANTKISTAQRQAIYDAILAQKTELGL